MYPGALAVTVAVMAATVAIAWYARRYSGSTLEFYLAGRTVNVFTNASAICGDYFSAASFLGVAGAVYASGMDGLWFGIGFAAGFVPVLLFLASPLRRFGEYTLPDFLAARFRSDAARLAGVAMVQLIALFYLAPQMVGAGTIWELLVGKGLPGLSPYATGVVVTALVMIVYTAVGGMRGTTWNQAVQFWIMVWAVAVLLLLGLLTGYSYSRALRDVSSGPLVSPETWRVADLLRPDPRTGQRPADRARAVMSEAYWSRHVAPRLGDPAAEVTVLMPQESRVRPGEPAVFNRPGHLYGPLDQVSVVLTLVLGTAGLPHVIMRYYTNPSGPVARWTTVYVLLFTSGFYLLASMIGVVARALTPRLATAGAGAVPFQVVDGLLAYPDQVMPFLAQSLGGSLVLGHVAAGAFAAMFSTIGGLLMASAASWGHDLYEQYIRPDAPEHLRVAVGKAAVVGMAAVALLLGLAVPRVALTRAFPAVIALMVTWAFSVSASGLVPVLITSVWWRGITLKGALAGMLAGGGGAVTLLALNVLRVLGSLPSHPWLDLLGQVTFPTLFTVPLAFATIFLVSFLDRRNIPDNLDEVWLRVHGTARERQERLLMRAAAAPRRRRGPATPP